MRSTGLAVILIALGLDFTGCAAIRRQGMVTTEQMLAAAGFHVELADTPEKVAWLQALPSNRVVLRHRDGEPSYEYPDAEACKCLYVGTEQQYREYQRLWRQKQRADDMLRAADESRDIFLNPGAPQLWLGF